MILEKSRTLALTAILSLPLQALAASPVVGPEHTRNLRSLEMAPMLFEYHRQTVGGERQFFTYPRRDTSFIRHFTETEGKALLYYDNLRGGAIAGHGLDLQCHEGDTSCVKNLETLLEINIYIIKRYHNTLFPYNPKRLPYIFMEATFQTIAVLCLLYAL